MGVSRQKLDPHTMDPVSAQRLASGVWHRRVDEDFMRGCPVEEWMLDVPTVQFRLQQILKSATALELAEYRDSPESFVDGRFGQGTMKALQLHRNTHTPYREKRHMALHYDPNCWKYYTGNNTSTISSGTSTNLYINRDAGMIDEPRATKDKVKFKPRPGIRVFRLNGRSLLEALQHDFDDFAGKRRRDLFPA